MEPLILLALAVLGVLIIMPIAAFVRGGRNQEALRRLDRRLNDLEEKLADFRFRPPPQPAVEPGAPIPTAVPQEPSSGAVQPVPETASTSASSPLPKLPPMLPAFLSRSPEIHAASPTGVSSDPGAVAEVSAASSRPVDPAEPALNFGKLKGTLNWEQFMGAKLFAWLGGFALFLGVAYFIKYSFEHNLIPPAVRVALGYLVGIGLVGGGVVMGQKRYAITAHTLCATGVLVLYGVTFACRAVYHFSFFGPGPTFGLMSVITIAAFLLAVRLDAQVVAVLGMMGGFCTPVLLSTGQDAPVGLFAYIALLDVGLLAVALYSRWFYLAALAAAGTGLMQIGWAHRFFEPGQYFSGNKVFIPMGVLMLFQAIWTTAAQLVRRRSERDRFINLSALFLAVVALGFGFYFGTFAPLASRPWLLFSFVFLVDGGSLWVAQSDRRLAAVPPLAGMAVFLFLAVWLSGSAINTLLPAALAFTLLFAVLHSLLPLVQARLGVQASPPVWTLIFPPLALALLLLPILRFTELTLLVWPVILLLDVLAIGLAAVLASAVPVLIVLALTLLAAAGAVFKITTDLTGLPFVLWLIAGCAVFFVLAGSWLRKRFATTADRAGTTAMASPALNQALFQNLPSFAAALPYLLLVMMAGRLPLTNPSPIFAIAASLSLLLLATSWKFEFEWLPVIGLACVAALEYTWHQRSFSAALPGIPLAWYLLFFGVFLIFPFVTRRFDAAKGPWIASALAGPIQFLLVYWLTRAARPNAVPGLLPAAFAVPPLAAVALLLRRLPDSPARLRNLAWFGGVALFFITLIFPIQFERQWLTLGWALEGVALCWLFHRLPHPGLRLTGLGLLVAAFARLSLNPAILSYHARGSAPIFNWYLYSYGIACLCLFMGAQLLAPPRDRVGKLNAPVLLQTLGTVLFFLLINLQIADFFTEPGTAALLFQFSGNFARDMSYTIAWALFALGLLVVGLIRQIRPARYAALALLGVALAKLFLHDLAHLAQLYRIAALIGVAVISILASFFYQKFSSTLSKADAPPPTDA